MTEAVEKKTRVTDKTNGIARRAVASTISRCTGWQVDLAHFAAWVERRPTTAEIGRMRERCQVILAEVGDARVDLIDNLMDAPRRVLANGRIADVEAALDNIDARARKLLSRLEAN